ncbi:MAG: VPLPA-CTERM-specific exosortase XrtD [Gammaproteobacteria bacterium]
MSTDTPKTREDRNVMIGVIAFVVALLGLLLTYFEGLKFMVGEWSQEEYSHGYLIPAIALGLLWQQRKNLFAHRWKGAWLGLLLVIFSTFLGLMGELSALYVIIQYAFLGSLVGLLLTLIGWRGMKYAWAPLLYLCFMIPLPDFLYNNLSAKLQLISSELGVAVIRAFGISVFLEGNVIDLGVYKLQVVEACSGLRYLFPLMSFGFLLAYMFKAPWWQRAIIFLSTIPITVLMNSFRIGVIGVLVDKYGIEQAEGFLHDFEGWIIFMACVGILLLMMKLFMVFSRDDRSLRDILNLEPGEPVSSEQVTSSASFGKPFFAAVGLIVIAALGSSYFDERDEVIPERERFTSFDLTIGDWEGRNIPVESVYLDVLKMEDYLSAQFISEANDSLVDVWVAYYSTQRKGVAIHSPKTCLPGGGWKIEKFEQKVVDNVQGAVNNQVAVNRTIMTQDRSRLLVYYWFKQRERNITNEYAMKWYLFWDSLTRKRTDGALMRLIVSVPDGTDIVAKEQILQDFMRESYQPLVEYVPD